jgi:hypothetical protein
VQRRLERVRGRPCRPSDAAPTCFPQDPSGWYNVAEQKE